LYNRKVEYAVLYAFMLSAHWALALNPARPETLSISPVMPAAGLRLRMPGTMAIPTSGGAVFKGDIQCAF